eukprot:SAG22_NODE_135_length_18211_cov_560.916519_12_plen_193_part_00
MFLSDLLHLATEYCFATKDYAFLAEPVHYYSEGAKAHTVLDGLLHAMNFTLHTIGTGPHGALSKDPKLGHSDLPEGIYASALRRVPGCVLGGPNTGLLRLLSSDWDDGFKPPPAAEPVSESVLTSALAAYVLPRWAGLLRAPPLAGGPAPVAAVTAAAAAEADEFGAGALPHTRTRSVTWDASCCSPWLACC